MTAASTPERASREALRCTFCRKERRAHRPYRQRCPDFGRDKLGRPTHFFWNGKPAARLPRPEPRDHASE
jgi:hypothetical protein